MRIFKFSNDPQVSLLIPLVTVKFAAAIVNRFLFPFYWYQLKGSRRHPKFWSLDFVRVDGNGAKGQIPPVQRRNRLHFTSPLQHFNILATKICPSRALYASRQASLHLFSFFCSRDETWRLSNSKCRIFKVWPPLILDKFHGSVLAHLWVFLKSFRVYITILSTTK